jgi:hypothetical protein
MPGGDRTGPMGMGPMTGRAAGFCAGFPVPGFMNPFAARGFWGRGRGGGRGWRNRFYATGVPGRERAAWGWPAFAAGWRYGVPYAAPYPQPAVSRDEELDLLKRQAEGFASTLAEIKKRIAELEAQPQEE